MYSATALLILGAILAGGLAPRLAGDLRPGMQLVYEANGVEQPPWTIVSVDAVSLMPGADCVRLQIRRRPDSATPDDARLCAARDTLFGWDSTGATWRPQRPLGANMTFVQSRANGDTVRYITGAVEEEHVDELHLEVLPTTVLTVDSLGRPKRRLRERYAVSLATATGGRFEAPDSTAPSGWRQEQQFALRYARQPADR